MPSEGGQGWKELCGRSPAAGGRGPGRAAELWEPRRRACGQPNLAQGLFAVTPTEGMATVLRVSDQCLCLHRDSDKNVFAHLSGREHPMKRWWWWRGSSEESAAGPGGAGYVYPPEPCVWADPSAWAEGPT